MKEKGIEVEVEVDKQKEKEDVTEVDPIAQIIQRHAKKKTEVASTVSSIGHS